MNKIVRTLIVLMGSLICANAFSNTDNIVGKWAGQLPIDKNSDISLHLNIKQESGVYTVKVSSSDNETIKDISADNVSYDKGKLKFDLADLNGSFEGTFKEGVIEGKWKQLNETIPLRLVSMDLGTPHKEGHSPELIKEFLGGWHGVATMAKTQFNSVMHFYLDDGGDLAVKMEFPDKHTDFVPVKSFSMNGRDIKAQLWADDNQYFEGRLENGVLQGFWWFGRLPFQVKLTKKDWNPDYLGFDISKENKEALLGAWYADAPAQGEGSTLKFSFIETESGKVRGYINSVDDGWYEIRVTDLKITNDQRLIFAHDGQYAGKIKFEGSFGKDEVKGHYTHHDLGYDLALKKGEVPPALLEFPSQVKESLVGEWNGQVDGKQFGVRFENYDGKLISYIDTMGQGRSAVRVRFGHFDNEKLTLETAQAGTQLNAKLVKGALVGELQSEGKNYNVKLVKSL